MTKIEIFRRIVGDDAIERRLVRWSKQIEEEWRALDADERRTLMALCCQSCGSLTLPCYCGRDE